MPDETVPDDPTHPHPATFNEAGERIVALDLELDSALERIAALEHRAERFEASLVEDLGWFIQRLAALSNAMAEVQARLDERIDQLGGPRFELLPERFRFRPEGGAA